MKLWMLAILVPVLGPPDWPAESYSFYRDHRTVSPSGQKYVVIRKQRDKLLTGITYELCRRFAGLPPMQNAKKAALEGWPGIEVVDINRDPRDQLLATGVLPQIPSDVRVLDELGGFLLFGGYAVNGLGKAITYIDDNGEVRVDLRAEDIFGRLPNRMGRDPWSLGYWVDERRGSVIIASIDYKLREVSLLDGSISSPEFEALRVWFKQGLEADRARAIKVGVHILEESAKHRKLELSALLSSAENLARDHEQALAIRLPAASLLIAAGQESNFAPLFQEACNRGQLLADRRYAVKHLAKVMGKDAMPFLLELLRKEPNLEVWSEWRTCFASFGASAMPYLTGMLVEAGQPSSYRCAAAHTLREIGSRRALPALRDALAWTSPDAEEYRALKDALRVCERSRY